MPGHMVVLRGGGISHERGTPVAPAPRLVLASLDHEFVEVEDPGARCQSPSPLSKFSKSRPMTLVPHRAGAHCPFDSRIEFEPWCAFAAVDAGRRECRQWRYPPSLKHVSNNGFSPPRFRLLSRLAALLENLRPFRQLQMLVSGCVWIYRKKCRFAIGCVFEGCGVLGL